MATVSAVTTTTNVLPTILVDETNQDDVIALFTQLPISLTADELPLVPAPVIKEFHLVMESITVSEAKVMASAITQMRRVILWQANRIKQLQTTGGTLPPNYTQLQADVATLLGDVGLVKTDVSQLKIDNVSQFTSINSLNGTVSAISTQSASNASQLTTLQGTSTQTVSRVTTLESSAAQTTRRFTALASGASAP